MVYGERLEGAGRPSQSHKVTNPVGARIRALERATQRGGGPVGSRLPEATQNVVAGHLRAGLSMAETARRLSLSRDQVRTVRYAMFGLTLNEARALKRGLRV